MQETISAVVRVYMVARGETQEGLAASLGISRPAVTQKLSGKSRWSLKDLQALSKHYDLTIEELVEGRILTQLGGDAHRARAGRGRARRAVRSA